VFNSVRFGQITYSDSLELSRNSYRIVSYRIFFKKTEKERANQTFELISNKNKNIGIKTDIFKQILQSRAVKFTLLYLLCLTLILIFLTNSSKPGKLAYLPVKIKTKIY